MKRKALKLTVIYLILACLLIGFSLTNANIPKAKADIFNGENIYAVSTFDELKEICFYNKTTPEIFIGKEIKLYNDIYLKGKGDEINLKGFKGNFNGNGRALIGYNVVGGLFENATGEITNLKFYDAESENILNSFGASKFSNIEIFGLENNNIKIYRSDDQTTNNFFNDLSSNSGSAAQVSNIFDIILHIVNHTSDAENYTEFVRDINFYNINIKKYIDNMNLSYEFLINPSLNNDFIAYNYDGYDYRYANIGGVETVTKSASLTGGGTKLNPYLISSKEDLQFLAEMADTEGLYFLQNQDINFRDINNIGDVIHYTVKINEFKGIYNGGGFAITNLTEPLIDVNYGNISHLTVSGTNNDCIFIRENHISGLVSDIEAVYLKQNSFTNGFFIESNLGTVNKVKLFNYESTDIFNNYNSGKMEFIDFGELKITNLNDGIIDCVISDYSDVSPIDNNNGNFKLINNAKKEINNNGEITKDFYSEFVVGRLVIPKELGDYYVIDNRLNKEIKNNSNAKVDNSNKDIVFYDGLEITLDYIKRLYTSNDTFFKDKNINVYASNDDNIMETDKKYFVGKYKAEISAVFNSVDYTDIFVKRQFTVVKANFSLSGFDTRIQNYLNGRGDVYTAVNYFNIINDYIKNEIIAELYSPGYEGEEVNNLIIDFSVRKNNISYFEIKNAGDYNLKLIIKKDHYNDYERDFVLKVNRAYLYFELADIPDVKFNEAHSFTYKRAIEGLLAGDTVDVQGKLDFSTNRLLTSNVGSGQTYYCDLKISDANSLLINPNYIAKVKVGRKYFNVIKNQLKIPDSIVKNIELTYNGLEQGFPSFSTELEKLNGMHGSIIKFYNYQKVKDVKYVDNEVKSYSINITFYADNYESYTLSRDIKILPKEITFFANNKETDYLKKAPEFTFSHSELAEGDKNKTFSQIFEGGISFACAYDERISNAGSYDISIIYNNLFSKNYSILPAQKGILKVNKIAFNFDIQNVNKDFDNREFAPIFITDRKDYTLEYYQGKLTEITGVLPISTPINAGDYTLKVIFSENNNYLESYKSFFIRINKIDLNFETPDEAKIYDGKAFTHLINFPEGGDFTALYTVSPFNGDTFVQNVLYLINAGSYEITLDILDKNGNYNDFRRIFYRDINKKELVVAGKENFVFSGKAVKLDYCIESGIVTGEEEKISIKLSTAVPIEEIIKVGSYSVIISCNDANYRISNPTRTVKITEFLYDVNLSNKNFVLTYGDSINLNEIIKLDLDGNLIDLSINYLADANRPTVGYYNIIKCNINNQEYQGNILLRIVNGGSRLNIVPKEISYDLVYQEKTVYNGEILQNVVKCENINGLVYDDVLNIEYLYNKEVKDVGEYNVIIKINNGNYTTSNDLKTVNFEVIKKDALIKFRDVSITFNTVLPPLSFIFSGFLPLDNPMEIVSLGNISHTTAYAKGRDCGKYAVSLYKVLENIELAKNYEIELEGGFVTVTESQINNVSLEDVTVDYSGYAVTPKINGDISPFNIEYSDKPINIGTVEVKVTFSAKNYISLSLFASVTIEPVFVILHAEDISVPYNKASTLKDSLIKAKALFDGKDVEGKFEFVDRSIVYGKNKRVIRFLPNSQNFKITETEIFVTANIDISYVYVNFIDGSYNEDENINYAKESISIMIDDVFYDKNILYYFDGNKIDNSKPLVITKSYDNAIIEIIFEGNKIGEIELGKIIIDKDYNPDEEPPVIPPVIDDNDKTDNDNTLLFIIIGGAIAVIFFIGVAVLILKRRN